MAAVLRKGVPIPPHNKGGKSEIRRRIEALESGDMLFFEDKQEFEQARWAAKNAKVKVQVRKLEDGWGLWIR